MKRFSYAFVAVLALAVLLAAAVPDPRPFIRVSGTHFMEGDHRFQFVGANLNVMHGDTARAQAAATIAAAVKDGLRVGRIWALGEGLADAPEWSRQQDLFRAGPTGWQEAAFLQLDRVLAEAGRQGLRLIVTLSNHWKDYGGIPMYLRWAGEVDVESYGYEDRFFTHARCRQWFLEHLDRVIGRTNSITGVPYADDPTILAWELQNEMNGTPEAEPARRRWVAEMAHYIRRRDPNHLIVPGLIGYSLQVERQDWIKMNQLPEVAFCDQHVYPEEHLRSRGLRNLQRYIDDRIQLAHYVVGKPIIFGEFGFSDQPLADARSRWHGQFLGRLFYSGGDGALVWIYQPKLAWKRTYGILWDQRVYAGLRRTLARYARRVLERPMENRNPRVGLAHGAAPIAPTHALLTGDPRPHKQWKRDAASATLEIPVERFARAWFEEAGSWDGGILVHAYGRRTGWFEYRLNGPGFVPGRVAIRARLSSEYPGSTAPAHGYSRVVVSLDGQELTVLRVTPDDGVGSWYTVEIRDAKLLQRLSRGLHRLSFEVREGALSNGVAIYGRETALNREPVDEPGPLQLVAYPPGAAGGAG